MFGKHLYLVQQHLHGLEPVRQGMAVRIDDQPCSSLLPLPLGEKGEGPPGNRKSPSP
jgi:hypothetical protein